MKIRGEKIPKMSRETRHGEKVADTEFTRRVNNIICE